MSCHKRLRQDTGYSDRLLEALDEAALHSPVYALRVLGLVTEIQSLIKQAQVAAATRVCVQAKDQGPDEQPLPSLLHGPA